MQKRSAEDCVYDIFTGCIRSLEETAATQAMPLDPPMAIKMGKFPFPANPRWAALPTATIHLTCASNKNDIAFLSVNYIDKDR
jgi:hypothetical protein